MKKIICITTSIFLAMLFMAGCANWGGNNPVGVTGGSESGYGESSDLNLPPSGSQPSGQLVGTWRHDYGGGDYELLEIKSNGQYQLSFYENNDYAGSYSGNYTVSGNNITLWVEGQPLTLSYALNGDTLILSFDGEQTTYYRV